MPKKIHQLQKNIFKFILLGSNGLLGNELKKILPKKPTLTISRKKADLNIDLRNFLRIENTFKKLKFKNVINCAAITNLTLCERKKKDCYLINQKLPIFLNKLSQKYNFNLIHVSSDQVYNSKTNKLNKETDKLGFYNYYSKTKLKAEKNLLKSKKKNLIIRTNFTGFKKNKHTFLSWLHKSMNKKKKLNLFEDMYVSTLDVSNCANIIKKLINKNVYGVYNVGTNKALTKKNFAIHFANKMKMNLNYRSVSLDVTKPKRPKYLGLNVDKVEKILKKKMISPKTAINNLVKKIKYENYRY
jgi:dTDP-4-dehydrorhamnose reductase